MFLFQKFSNKKAPVRALSTYQSVARMEAAGWVASGRYGPEKDHPSFSGTMFEKGLSFSMAMRALPREGGANGKRRRLRPMVHFSKMHFSKMHFSKILQIFVGLVLGCIKTKFCKKICVWQHFSSSTRFAYFCTAAISKFSQKNRFENQQFSWKFSKNFANVAKFAKFCQISKISAR